MDRKQIKKRARRSVREHLGVWILLCMLWMMLTGEQILTNSWLQTQGNIPMAAGNVTTELSRFSDQMMQLVNNLFNDNDTDSEALVQESITRSIDDSPSDAILGHSRGALSTFVNRITSGSYLLTIGIALRSVLGSGKIAAIFLVLLGMALIVAYRFFIMHTYQVVMARMFLEGRQYKTIHLSRSLFLVHTKCWLKVSGAMFRVACLQVLWNLTIIGGIIKHYSYRMVPYILAENPTISGKEAIALSGRMMDGHKWECFKLEVSFYGWELLNIASFGVSKVLFVRPYQEATFSEYYAGLRKICREAGVEGIEQLNDTYLFEFADDKLLLATYPEAYENREEEIALHLKSNLKGIRSFLLEVCGLKLRNTEIEKEYEKAQMQSQKLFFDLQALNREIYPSQLHPIEQNHRRHMHIESLALRCYSVWSLIIVFFVLAVVGWFWELSLHLLENGTFINRGVLHGPWLPIYGVGCLLILLFLYRFRHNPIQEFALIIVLCGSLEYFTSFFLEHQYGQLWWDYRGYFLNLNGRICAEGLLVFGLGGIAVVYFIAPLIDRFVQKFSYHHVMVFCYTLLLLFSADFLYSCRHPNEGKEITVKRQNTEMLRQSDSSD